MQLTFAIFVRILEIECQDQPVDPKALEKELKRTQQQRQDLPGNLRLINL